MLQEICQEIRNYFYYSKLISNEKISISKGKVPLPGLLPTQYFRITGSSVNDGVYQLSDDGETILNDDGTAAKFIDEDFEGTIYAMAVPKPVIEIAKEIADWQKENGKAAASPYTSESFGTYSRSKGGGGSSGSSAGITWRDIFRNRLNAWRKI